MNHVLLLRQLNQLENPDARILLEKTSGVTLLASYADSYVGLQNGDTPRYIFSFWEVGVDGDAWAFLQMTADSTAEYAGRDGTIRWERGAGSMMNTGQERIQGTAAWSKSGVAIRLMQNLPCTLYSGDRYDQSSAVLIPRDPSHLPAVWCFCSSPDYNKAVRAIDQTLKVTNATLVKVPFDLKHWQKVAAERYPDGLSEPYSDDPTQWLFRGDIPSGTDPLQVAMARLLGYRWPNQPAADAALDPFVDSDGIVTLAPLVKQDGAANRLRAMLQAAYSSPAPDRAKGAPPVEESRVWDETRMPRLLAGAGFPGMSLDEWLRDRFFEGHCKRFHHRPFLWHIWDGRKDGFHAIVNYHLLDHRNLERLTHVYLGEWIERQKAEANDGDRTAEARLIAAQQLQAKLELIRIGEPPYDIFVRWKSLAEQPMGWDPDLNDGVRMNIRPFVEAGVLRCKVNVNWNKDRGKDPSPNVSGTVERRNDLHFTLAEKVAARRAASGGAQ